MRPTISKSPHYPVRNPYSYCFRIKVPQDLQNRVGKKELRYSMKTGYLSIARARAQILVGQVQLIFACLRKGGRRLSDLSDEKIQELVQQYLRDYIENLESRYYDSEPFVNSGEFYGYISDLDAIKDDIIRYLGIGDYSTVEGIVLDLLKKNEKEGIQKDSVSHIKICRAVLRAQLKGIDLEKKHMSGDFSEALEAPVREQLQLGKRLYEEQRSGLLSEVIELHVAETGTNWEPKTKDENISILNLFKEVVGDVPIQSITRKKVGEFKQTLQKLPPNMKKNPRYRDKSISEILRMNVPKKMSATTVSKYLTRVGALFEYARKNGIYEGQNPATGMNPPKNKRAHEARAPYNKDELIKLFHSEEYLKDRHDKPYQFWMPLLGLFGLTP